MSKCAAIEPAPTRFYAAFGLFSASELSQMGAECLGEFITSPGGSFRYQVASGPLCRIYWGNGKPEPHSFESAYVQHRSERWKTLHLNYVSYLSREWRIPHITVANADSVRITEAVRSYHGC